MQKWGTFAQEYIFKSACAEKSYKSYKIYQIFFEHGLNGFNGYFSEAGFLSH